jgi:hypothetical protein
MTEKEKVEIRAVSSRLDGKKPETSKIPTVEEAIAAWETNKEKNPEGYKIVRGLNGKPVKVLGDGDDANPVFAIVVNGKKEPFQIGQIGGSMKSMEEVLGDLQFRQFINGDVFNGWYEIKGIQRLKARVSRHHQGFVFGKLGPKPKKFEVIRPFI